MAFNYQSWGRFPQAAPRQIVRVFWRDALADLSGLAQPMLPYAYGRSYGDCCLNGGGTLLDASFLRRFIAFDSKQGMLRCEAGIPLGEVLQTTVPAGWFLPVTPGTQYVSVGGAIANDIHGKNHHQAGTFGRYVTRFELLRSNGERMLCSADEHPELFRATIGGLGLTGLILWAEFRLKPVGSPWMQVEQVRFGSLDEFFAVADASDNSWEYTVAWVDCLSSGRCLGRGLYLRGNHEQQPPADGATMPQQRSIRVRFEPPSVLLNGLSMRLFNSLFFHAPRSRLRKRVSYARFFFHLDGLRDWNRLYGRQGLIQYQCVVPLACARKAVAELMRQVASSGEGAFLSILKRFGMLVSPGLLSFPRPGLTLAMDFPNRGRRTLSLLDHLDAIVRGYGGGGVPGQGCAHER